MSVWREAEKLAASIETRSALEAAKRRADVLGMDDEAEDPPVAVRRPSAADFSKTIIVENFSLSMIEFDGSAGAVLDVRQITKMEAAKLAYESGAKVANVLPERSMQLLEKELQLDTIDRIQLRPNVTFLCVTPVRWNDVRFYLVRLLADGDGVVG